MKRVGGSSGDLDDGYRKIRRSTDAPLPKYVPGEDVMMEPCYSSQSTPAGDKPAAPTSTDYLNGLINGFNEMNVSFKFKEPTVDQNEEPATVATAKPVMDPRTRRRILTDADPRKTARHADLRMVARHTDPRKGVQNIGHQPSIEQLRRDQKARDMARIRNQERFDRDMARRQLSLKPLREPDMPTGNHYVPYQFHGLSTSAKPSSSTQNPTNSEVFSVPASTDLAPNWNPLAFRTSTLAKYSQVRDIITAKRRHSDVCLTEMKSDVDAVMEPPLPTLSPPPIATCSATDVASLSVAKRRNPLNGRRILTAHRRLQAQNQAKPAAKEI